MSLCSMRNLMFLCIILCSSCRTTYIINSYNNYADASYKWQGWVKLSGHGQCYVELTSLDPFNHESWFNVPAMNAQEFSKYQGKIITK